MKTSMVATLALATTGPSSAQETRDGFYWLDRLNRASLIMMSEERILTPEQVSNIASSLDKLYQKASEPGFSRGSTYSSIEPRLIEIGGPEVSRLHTGRSSWDTGATNLRLQQRELLLKTYEALIKARQSMLDFGTKYANALIPAYTGGVQAQPVSMGHYITAYLGVFARHAENFEETYKTLNLSPMGAAALGGSSYPLNRHRMSELLGFDQPIHNSYDAVLLSPLEVHMRLGGVAAGISLTAGQLMADLENQYYLTRPWLTFPANLTGGSTIMPQKLNPDGINNTRERANDVMGNVVGYLFDVHKAASGHFETSYAVSINAALENTMKVLDGIDKMFDVLIFNEERALQQVLDDYATATELANTLQRVGNIPFRDAHHVAAEVVQFGRKNEIRASEIKFNDFETVFREAAAKHHMTQTQSGLTEEDFRRALTPKNMVESAKVYGGPQPSEVQAMLKENAAAIAADQTWLDEKRKSLEAASKALDGVFAGLMSQKK
jgi:argininosuccinate lyase